VLARCYRSCFVLAEQHDVRTIAFPSISTGVYGFPIHRAARIALTEIQAFLRRNGSVERVVVVCFQQQAFDAYTAALPAIVGHNTDPAFVGIAAIKKKQSKQLTLFEQWAREERWEKFHSEHYDWWMFPIDEESSYGRAWTVYEGDIAELKKDAEYIQKYLNGARLLALSWGWDMDQQSLVANPKPAQRWQRWPIRLYKAAKSLKLFGFVTQFESMKKYANGLMAKGESLLYHGRGLGVLFR
jgi:Macro domain